MLQVVERFFKATACLSELSMHWRAVQERWTGSTRTRMTGPGGPSSTQPAKASSLRHLFTHGCSLYSAALCRTRLTRSIRTRMSGPGGPSSTQPAQASSALTAPSSSTRMRSGMSSLCPCPAPEAARDCPITLRARAGYDVCAARHAALLARLSKLEQPQQHACMLKQLPRGAGECVKRAAPCVEAMSHLSFCWRSRSVGGAHLQMISPYDHGIRRCRFHR